MRRAQIMQAPSRMGVRKAPRPKPARFLTAQEAYAYIVKEGLKVVEHITTVYGGQRINVLDRGRPRTLTIPNPRSSLHNLVALGELGHEEA